MTLMFWQPRPSTRKLRHLHPDFQDYYVIAKDNMQKQIFQRPETDESTARCQDLQPPMAIDQTQFLRLQWRRQPQTHYG